MKKFLLSILVIGVFGLYALHQRTDTERKVTPPVSLSTSSSQTSSQSSSSGSSSSDSTQNASPPANSSKYKDGSFTGDSADAFYGNIQVKAIIQNGKIVDVQFLDYPSDRSTSIEINQQAMPYLKQEAISAQNANVDIVSGATDSSMAFRQSLASALNQAQ